MASISETPLGTPPVKAAPISIVSGRAKNLPFQRGLLCKCPKKRAKPACLAASQLRFLPAPKKKCNGPLNFFHVAVELCRNSVGYIPVGALKAGRKHVIRTRSWFRTRGNRGLKKAWFQSGLELLTTRGWFLRLVFLALQASPSNILGSKTFDPLGGQRPDWRSSRDRRGDSSPASVHWGSQTKAIEKSLWFCRSLTIWQY